MPRIKKETDYRLQDGESFLLTQIIVELGLRRENGLLLVGAEALPVVPVLELAGRLRHGQVVVEHHQLPRHTRRLESLLASLHDTEHSLIQGLIRFQHPLQVPVSSTV